MHRGVPEVYTSKPTKIIWLLIPLLCIWCMHKHLQPIAKTPTADESLKKVAVLMLHTLPLLMSNTKMKPSFTQASCRQVYYSKYHLLYVYVGMFPKAKNRAQHCVTSFVKMPVRQFVKGKLHSPASICLCQHTNFATFTQ